jgi:hypothetical protein
MTLAWQRTAWGQILVNQQAQRPLRRNHVSGIPNSCSDLRLAHPVRRATSATSSPAATAITSALRGPRVPRMTGAPP